MRKGVLSIENSTSCAESYCISLSPIIPPINSKQIDIRATRDKIRFSKVDSTELVPRNNICVKQDDRMKTKATTSYSNCNKAHSFNQLVEELNPF